MTQLPFRGLRTIKALAAALVASQAVPCLAAAPYCLPGDACFPTVAELAAFNATVDGALIKSVPYGAACYAATYDAVECKMLAEIKKDPSWRLNLSAGVMYTNWEQDGLLGEKGGCPVPDPNSDGTPPPPVNGQCTLGGMPSYVVNVSRVDHIVASVKFAAKHNLRFRIKNSGHDYLGRSSDPGSFSIWTRHMKDAHLIEGFAPENCAVAPQDVISAGPGINVGELNAVSAAAGRVTIGASASTVGVAGGFLLGGGVGPLGPILGMGVDNLVQAEVVTADGERKVTNACIEPDLFWALRGGGGAFGVVTRVYIKAYPALSAVNTVGGSIGCANRASFEGLVKTIVDTQLLARQAGHTGVWACYASRLGCAYLSIVPFTSGATVLAANTTMATLQPILAAPGCANNLRAAQFTGSRSWNDAYQSVVSPLVGDATSVGVSMTVHSRIMSRDLVEDSEGRERIKQLLLSLPSPIPFLWQNTVGGAVAAIAPDDTAVHPAWRSAFNFIDIPIPGPWSGLTREVIDVGRAVVANVTAVFGTAAYYNEDFVLERSWQESFFGSNYPRLLAIKRHVDPTGLFNCRQCVGSEDGF